ncbi:cytochrome P450 [Apodospora peruviana]|uniref:Cytochrome P450 n=1 Tax=Apodospora peruviana TaxID=516989 RepID=A0AAE0ID03_9PEZI|nr:cytochrome P450 [Apodospora peruviana]
MLGLTDCPLTILVGVGAGYIFLRLLLHLTQDPKEPPAVETTIPFVGPIVGMLTKKTDFYTHLRDEHRDLPMYTLRLPGSRIYVVNSLSMIPVVQRQIKTIAFTPIEAQAADKVMGMSKAANDILSTDMDAEGSYLSTFVKFIHPAVSPGPGLDALNRAAVEVISRSLDTSAQQANVSGGSITVELFDFLRHEIFQATTEAIYGPENPMRCSKMERMWYKFEPGIMMLMLGLPWLVRHAYRAREAMIPVIETYYARGGHKSGSMLAQCRYDHNTHHGLGPRDIACSEIGGVAASVTNTVPSAFWFAYHVLSDPVVLADCRVELEELVTSGGHGRKAIDIARVKNECPMLLSTWQEVLRVYSTGIAARVVLEDHFLDGRFLLKKGATVMMINPVAHTDPTAWGLRALQFDHRRFLKGVTGGQEGPHKSRSAFRPFGGGTTLCPGRHFASTEILAFVALLILRFDVVPLEGRWKVPKQNGSMTSSLPMPGDKVMLRLVPRADDEEWDVTFSGSDKGLKVSAEDMERGGE